MSRFTTELRFMFESWNDQTQTGAASDVMTVINNTRQTLFDFDYPHSELTNEEKEHLEKNFMLQFYTREIGFETFGLFKHKLQAKLWSIMPKYNKLYAVEHENLDFFSDVDWQKRRAGDVNKRTGSISHANSGSETTTTTGSYKDTNAGDITNVQTGSVKDTTGGTDTKTTSGKYKDTNSGSDISVYSDTPQSTVDIPVTDGYATNVTKDTRGTATEREYTNLQEQDQGGKWKETTYNDATLTSTNEQSVERTFDDYQVENENNKTLTDTYTNLLDTTDVTEHTWGNMGNNIDKLNKYRDNVMNLEQMIINDCSDLFMLLYY